MSIVNANATIYEELPQQLAALVVDAEWSASQLVLLDIGEGWCPPIATDLTAAMIEYHEHVRAAATHADRVAELAHQVADELGYNMTDELALIEYE